jgi:hypothetical protein
MTLEPRTLIARAIAEDERWVAQARALVEPDVDCSSIEESIAGVERDLARMRALLGTLK